VKKTLRLHPVGAPPAGQGTMAFHQRMTEAPMKKLLFLAILGGVSYLVYRQYMASQAEQDLWAEATAAPDLR